ncbi:MAG: S8 family serine peptidase [Myxococcales bacterium]|nr:S8 family serine peptidase [Myxococcales bacterium]
MNSFSRSSPFCLLGLVIAACGVEDEGMRRSSQALFSFDQALEEPTIVYESVRTVTGDEVVESSVQGEITDEIWARVARPWLYMDEATLYHEQMWTMPTGPETVEEGYRIVATPNTALADYSTEASPIAIDPLLVADLAGDPDEEVTVSINIRGLLPARIPLHPPFLLSAEDIALASAARDDALSARESEFQAKAAALVEEVAALKGTVLQTGSRSGWLLIAVPRSALPALMNRDDVLSIYLAPLHEGGFHWALGDGRSDARIGADRFHAQGYTGYKSNPARHNFGAVTLAIADTRLEDEACFLFSSSTNCSGSSRLIERFSCYDGNGNGDWCLGFQPDYADSDTQPGHGTTVTSIALGDYEDGQADSFPVGDPNWNFGHTSSWEQDHSGMAPESRLIYFDISQDATLDSRAATDSLVDAANRHVDIFNGSWSVGGSSCAAAATLPVEQALEDAFDDGVFVVLSAGNNRDSQGNCMPDWTTCSVQSPADTMKAFAVNAYDSSVGACNASFNACEWDHCDYRLGGMDVQVNGVTQSGAVSIIAGLAPDGISGTTNNQGTYGTVVSGAANGTSMAAPHVAGLAALVKDQYLNTQFNSWINSPGWMYTLMLAMTDRYFEHALLGLTQSTQGSNDVYGLGKIRLRLLGTGGGLGALGTAQYSLQFSSGAGNWSATLWSSSMPSNANLLKCVMFNAEDMSPPKVDISDVDLTLKLYAPGSGTSCTTLGALQSTRTDNQLDFKRQVAYEQPATTLANRCARVELSPQWIHPTQGASAKLFCYYSTVRDDETPQ